MDKKRPKPKKVGGKLQYTLTSYDPVRIEVEIPLVTHEETELAIDDFASQAGISRSDMTNDWVAENFPDISTYAEFFREMRERLSKSAIEYVEAQKRHLCVKELVKRLVQDIDHNDYLDTRKGIELSILNGVDADGLSIEELFSKTGMSREAFEKSLDEQALVATQQNAALDAWVQWRKLEVDDFELPGLLYLDVERCGEIVASAKVDGSIEIVYDMARRNKALNSIVAECACTYHRETQDEAKERMRRMREGSYGDGPAEKPEFKLV